MNQNLWKTIIVIIVLAFSGLACGFNVSTASIKDAQMARDEAGTQLTTVFAPTDIFFVNVDLQNAPDDTTVKAVWTAVQVEGADANTTIDETELESGSGTLNFQLSNSQPWPSGLYKVDLYLNDELNKTIEFQVE